MEDVMVKEFLDFNYGFGDGSGYGYGDGSGYGYGSGSGSGSGDGSGYGDGSGSGYGFGSGDGDGYGDGSGSGYGSGYGSGSGSGYGDGSGSGTYGDGSGYGYKINNKLIHKIDNTPTIISSVKGNVARGYIVNNDLTLTKTYISKNDGLFAHGSSIKKAIQALADKVIANLDTDEIIEMFLQNTKLNKKYPASYFFDWHGKLTGSCLQGRELFVKNNNIDLNADMDVKEFIEICKNSYGSEIIQNLEKIINESEDEG